jgi:3-methyladenine DNA glycosylase AlkD
MDDIILKIQKELEKLSDPEKTKEQQRWFKERVKTRGIETPKLRKISVKYFQEIKNLEKDKIFHLCEALLKTGYLNDKTIAFDWAFRIKKTYQPKDFKVFESWLKKYVDNWASCDDLCTHNLGYLLNSFPQLTNHLNQWAKSKNRWLRRAASVSLIYPMRKQGKYLDKVFEIADIVLLDKDDLVQKGYGWMLKTASEFYPNQVLNYLMKNKDKMPRTALRYALEKYPQEMRKKAMSKK